MSLAGYWYEKTVLSGKAQGILASSSLDLPFVVAMALIDKYVYNGTTRFLLYNSDRDQIEGLSGIEDSNVERVAVIDCIIKGGQSLTAIARLLESRGLTKGPCCGLFSLLDQKAITEVWTKEVVVAQFLTR